MLLQSLEGLGAALAVGEAQGQRGRAQGGVRSRLISQPRFPCVAVGPPGVGRELDGDECDLAAALRHWQHGRRGHCLHGGYVR